MKEKVNMVLDSDLKKKMQEEAKKVNQSLTAWIVSAAHFYMNQSNNRG